MKCQKCQHDETKVIESRELSDSNAVRRRRKCINCGHRFTTYERFERPQLVVVKNSGAREMFNRNKMLDGLQRACEKTLVSSIQLDSMVSKIENELYDSGEPEVESAEIGKKVIKELADVNEVAYVRFASVYGRFSDITGFEAELAQLRAKKKKSK